MKKKNNIPWVVVGFVVLVAAAVTLWWNLAAMPKNSHASTTSFAFTAPAGGEVWNHQEVHHVKWTSSLPITNLVNITMVDAKSGALVPGGFGTVGGINSGDISWYINSYFPSGTFKLKIASTSSPSVVTYSNVFTISSVISSNPVILTTGQYAYDGYNRYVWSTIPFSKVVLGINCSNPSNIYISGLGVEGLGVEGCNGTYTVSLASPTIESIFSILVKTKNGATTNLPVTFTAKVYDASGNFIGTASDMATAFYNQPILTVTSPTVGQVWQAGTTKKITWDSSGLPSNTYVNVDIMDFTNSSNNVIHDYPIARVPASQGYYMWQVPSLLNGYILTVPGNYFKIDVSDTTQTDNATYYSGTVEGRSYKFTVSTP